MILFILYLLLYLTLGVLFSSMYVLVTYKNSTTKDLIEKNLPSFILAFQFMSIAWFPIMLLMIWNRSWYVKD